MMSSENILIIGFIVLGLLVWYVMSLSPGWSKRKLIARRK